MKTKIFLLGACLSLLTIGCNKDDDNTPKGSLNAEEVSNNNQLNNISDDVTQIAEQESDESVSGRPAGGDAFLSNCASVNDVVTGNTVVRTIDFGTANCMLWSHNYVRGKIILTFNNDYSATSRTISYAFDNFYHNDRHIEGNRTVIRTILANGHPQAAISLDMTVTLVNGNVYHRTGNRVREFYEGYGTPGFFGDNKFRITGSWQTTFPNGTVHDAVITSPGIIDWGCQYYLTQGTLSITRQSDSATAVFDYGDGTCDNHATVSFNGGTPIDFTF